MESNFSQRVKDVITYSREEALRLGHDYIGIEHLLLGMIREGEGVGVQILNSLGANLTELRQKIESATQNGSSNPIHQSNINIPLVKQAERVLKITYLEAKTFKQNLIGTEHLLLSILKDENNIATQALEDQNINYELAKEELESILSDKPQTKSELPGSPTDGDKGKSNPFGGNPPPRSGKTADGKSKTPVLDNFGRDLTEMAEQDKLDPIVGREKEIERVSQILSRRKKNNPILIGEPGVGKSAIAEGLALRIVQKKVSRVLFNKRIVT